MYQMKMVNQKSQSMEKIIMDKEKEKLSKEIVSSQDETGDAGKTDSLEIVCE